VPTLSWAGPVQVKAGEQFSVVLRVSSQSPLRGLPLLAAFDPQALQLVTALEGDFFRQGGGTASFSHRVDPAQGKLFVAALRQAGAGNAAGVNGSGSVVTAVFKALKAGPARLQLLSATPEPPPGSPLPLPLEYLVKVLP
jgi:general secretion pathway protein D